MYPNIWQKKKNVSEHGAADVVKISRCCGAYTSNQLLWSSMLETHHSSQQDVFWTGDLLFPVGTRTDWPHLLLWCEWVWVCVFEGVNSFTYERSLPPTFWPSFNLVSSDLLHCLLWIWLNLKELPFKKDCYLLHPSVNLLR